MERRKVQFIVLSYGNEKMLMNTKYPLVTLAIQLAVEKQTLN